MKLKALELHGYKSFANRMDFAFHDGVTSIVGPNGSGKSNVADAIQWVLGEQSFSSLRAKKTEDMIFAGSSMRLRMGMAEVSLTLDNSEQWLPIEFSEVTVTRRAYRSGENEYLLNGNRVRLRDINELLSKGGLGRGSYSVIGQGLIDQAISLRPEERRSLLEDAAGISIYQSKKADALSKLNATQENLTRVSDILHELEPRVKRLREQANRAGQFNDVQRKLAERLQTWYGYQWQQAQTKLAEAEQTAQRTQDELAGAREGLQASDAERATLRERIQSQRTELNELQRQLNEQQRTQQQVTQRRAVAQERLDLLTQQHEEAQRELESLTSEADALTQQRAQLTSELSELQASAHGANARLSELQQTIAQREESMRSARQSQADAQRGAVGLATQIAQHTQRTANARQRLQSIADELALQQSASEQHMRELQSLGEHIAAAHAQGLSLDMQITEHATRVNELQQQATAAQTHAADLGAQLAEAQAELRATQIEFERARSRGTQQTLSAMRAAGVDDVQPLNALYRVAPEHDKVVRGALGAFADAVVVPHWRDAEQMAAQSSAQQIILVLESFDGNQLQPVPYPATQARESVLLPSETAEGLGVSVSAFDLITCADEYRALFQLLLASVHVGDGTAVPRVNQRGELLTQHALITSDKSAPNLAALEAHVTEWQRKVADMPTLLEQARAAATEAVQQRDTSSSERFALDSERAKVQAELDALARERERVQRESQRVASVITRLRAEQTALAPQLDEWQQTLEQLQAKQQSLTPLGAAASESSDDDLALTRQLAQHETRAALLTQEWQSRQQTLAQMEQRLRMITTQHEQRACRAESLRDETNRLRSELAQLDEQATAIAARIEPLRTQAQPLDAQLSADESVLRAREAQERTSREALYAAEAAHSQALVDLQRRQDRLTTLREQIESDYEFVSLTTDLPTALALEMDENRVLRLPHVGEIPDGMEQDIRALKNKMRWIGNVNLEAPSEHALEKARLEFLQVQSTDLQRASESLQQLVAELDQLMQNKFRETFQAVARAFKEYFTRLFGGGSAELTLTEPQNLIATGVDIIAHPPGKRRQPLGLLSGGERALTAAALIFALLKASPTPFCVLDEVDAALDEANVGRFRSTLEELAGRTQFIVITHNRGTVEAAGTVYGISMGADGASQMISLRLDGADVKQLQAA